VVLVFEKIHERGVAVWHAVFLTGWDPETVHGIVEDVRNAFGCKEDEVIEVRCF
jgi:hypothetical protein